MEHKEFERGGMLVEPRGRTSSAVGLSIIRPSENHLERVQLSCSETILLSNNFQTLRALTLKAAQHLESAKQNHQYHN